jgi:uncharacterized protein (TIGR00645 family)
LRDSIRTYQLTPYQLTAAQGEAMQQIERRLQTMVLAGRWLMLPFFAGLLIAILLLLYKFGAELIGGFQRLPGASSAEVIVGVLNLVDYVLTANLILIVIFAGYDNFIGRLQAAKDVLPDGIIKVGFTDLKQKILGSIMALAAVEMLEVYMNLQTYPDTSKLGWLIGMQLTFVLSMLMLAIADRLAEHRRKDG